MSVTKYTSFSERPDYPVVLTPIEESPPPHPDHYSLWQIVCQYLPVDDVMSLARTSSAWYHHLTHDSFIWSLERFRPLHPLLCAQIEKEEETDRARWLQIKKLFTRRVAAIPQNIRWGRCVLLDLWSVGKNFNCVKIDGDFEYATQGGQLSFRSNRSIWQDFGAHEALIDRLTIRFPYLYSHCEKGVLKVWDLRKMGLHFEIDCCEQFRLCGSKDSPEVYVLKKPNDLSHGVVQKWEIASRRPVLSYKCPLETQSFDFHNTTLWIASSKGELLRASQSLPGHYDLYESLENITNFCIQEDLLIVLSEKNIKDIEDMTKIPQMSELKVTNLVDGRSKKRALPKGIKWKDYEGDQQSVGGIFIHLEAQDGRRSYGYLHMVDPVQLRITRIFKDPKRCPNFQSPQPIYDCITSFNIQRPPFRSVCFYDRSKGMLKDIDLMGSRTIKMLPGEIDSNLKIIEQISAAWKLGKKFDVISLQDQLSERAWEFLADLCQMHHGKPDICLTGIARLKTFLYFNLFLDAIHCREKIDTQLIQDLDPEITDLLWAQCERTWNRDVQSSNEQLMEDLCGNGPFPTAMQKEDMLFDLSEWVGFIWMTPWASIPELGFHCQEDYEVLGISVLQLHRLVNERCNQLGGSLTEVLLKVGGLQSGGFPPLLKPIAGWQRVAALPQDEQWVWVNAVRNELEILVSCFSGESEIFTSYREEALHCLRAIDEENLSSAAILSDFMHSPERGVGVFVSRVNTLIAIWNESVNEYCEEQKKQFVAQLKEELAEF